MGTVQGWQRKSTLRFMQPLETDSDGKVRKRRCFSAVGGGTVLLDKETPAEEEKEVVDEIIFRTTNPRNRLMLELMARAG